MKMTGCGVRSGPRLHYKLRSSVLMRLTMGLSIIFSCQGKITPIPLENEKVISAVVKADEATCYLFEMDANKTREVVYWPQAKLYIRLEPCVGMPHLRVSVYGCPSDGNVINWEYMSERARTDLRAQGQPMPADWEWPGDVETLSVDVTHKRFYVEVVQRRPPLRTNGSLYEFEALLRSRGFRTQADEVAVIYAGPVTPAQAQRLSALQGLLVPSSQYFLSATLHDESRLPTARILPMNNAAGWVRDVAAVLAGSKGLDFTDDPTAGDYIISFWPPTRTPNASAAAANGSALNSTALRRASAPAPAPAPGRSEDGAAAAEEAAAAAEAEAPRPRTGVAAVRELLRRRDLGRPVLWGDVAEMLRDTEEGRAARRVLAMEDVLFPSAHPGVELTAPRALHRLEAEASQEDRDWAAELEDTDRRLRELADMKIPGFEEAVESGVREYWARRAGRAAAAAGRALSPLDQANGTGNASANASAGPAAGQWTAQQRAAYGLQEEDLEYMVYWAEITAAMRARWGASVDALGNNLTRLLDNPCDVQERQCGVLQHIPRRVFRLLDRDGDGRLTRAEYEALYPPEAQGLDNGFIAGYSFAKAAANGTGGAITLQSWVRFFGGAQAILQASLKDATLRTLWTPCGAMTWGTPLGPSGNASKDPRLAEWLPATSFDQMDDGRLIRRITGLNDSDNNVYMISIVVRNRVTGETAAYKLHTVQRQTPVYRPPEIGPTQVALLVGVSVSIGAIFIIFIIAVLITRRKKTRPKLRIRKQ